MKHAISLGLVLFAVWLLWSGHFTPLLVSLGLVSTLAVVFIGKRMRVMDEEGAPLDLPLRALRFLPWLGWQIVKANLHVAGRILGGRVRIRPTLIRVKASQKRELGRVIYANCITLTPGTVAVDLEGDQILVHALTPEAADELRSGEMDRKVTDYEGLS